MAATTQLAADEYISNGDLTIHVRVNDPDYDVSATGEDKIANGTAAVGAPVKISIIRGSETNIIGYAGTAAAVKGTIDTNGSGLTSVRTFGPMYEIAPDAGIFEADITIRYTDGPDSSSCPVTNVFTNILDSSGTTVTDRFDEAPASGENYCILQGDILQVEYTDGTDASGSFIGRGITTTPVDMTKKYHFVPTVSNGDEISAGNIIGTVQEDAPTHSGVVSFDSENYKVADTVTVTFRRR
jgi:hypothetical protein